MTDRWQEGRGAAGLLADRFNRTIAGHGASFDELAEIADDGTKASTDELMGMLRDGIADGSIERVNGVPDADGSLSNPAVFRRPRPDERA